MRILCGIQALEQYDAAFALLESCDWVVGPARDGGYYLIGCRGPAFDNASWLSVVQTNASCVVSST